MQNTVCKILSLLLRNFCRARAISVLTNTALLYYTYVVYGGKMTDGRYKIAIIGGGSAGMYLAAMLASCGRGTEVVLIESGARLGRKLAVTGNGQGNVSNVNLDCKKYFTSNSAEHSALINDIIGQPFSLLKLFDGLFTADGRGRIYPAGKQANALVDCLRRKIEDGGVSVRLNSKAVSVSSGFAIKPDSGKIITADKVVIAAGGKAGKQFGTDGTAYSLATALGHTVTPLFPALVQLKTDTSRIKTLKGLRAPCNITATAGGNTLGQADGEIIFADYGVTGSAVFAVSSFITDEKDITLHIEFAPELSEKQIKEDIERNISRGCAGTEIFGCTVPKQLARVIVGNSGNITPKEAAARVKRFTLPVCGNLGFDNAQVTRGGIPLSELTQNLESKLQKNLFIIGEMLDVTGECGGYNLHWAFSSATRVFGKL